MGLCCDSEKEQYEFKTVEDDSLPALEFGDSKHDKTVGYQQGSDLIMESEKNTYTE